MGTKDIRINFTVLLSTSIQDTSELSENRPPRGSWKQWPIRALGTDRPEFESWTLILLPRWSLITLLNTLVPSSVKAAFVRMIRSPVWSVPAGMLGLLGASESCVSSLFVCYSDHWCKPNPSASNRHSFTTSQPPTLPFLFQVFGGRSAALFLSTVQIHSQLPGPPFLTYRCPQPRASQSQSRLSSIPASLPRWRVI